MKENLKILYVGSLMQGSTSWQRMRALQELGHSLTPVNFALKWLMKQKKPPLYYRIINKIMGPPDLTRVNMQIIQASRREKFDILWLEKGLVVKPGTLRKVKEESPETLIIGYSPDDMNSRHNQSKKFLACLPCYDWYCTTKTYNVQELKDLGCPRVMFTGNAYDPDTHRPMELSAEEKGRFGGLVGFVGGFEDQRAKSIAYLADQGIRVGVWGNGWQEKCQVRHPNLCIKGPSIYGDGYAKAICSFDIVLGFLRKINRDLQTQRSVEIPACGAFMLAERTDEHLALFAEGEEAEFFETDAELLEKVRYYLAHESERKRIALAGRERCLKSGYSYGERIKSILEKIYDN